MKGHSKKHTKENEGVKKGTSHFENEEMGDELTSVDNPLLGYTTRLTIVPWKILIFVV